MPRKNFDPTSIRFATGSANGTIAYRPNQVLIRTIPLDDADVDQVEEVINLALTPALARVPGAEVGSLGELLQTLIGWFASPSLDVGQSQKKAPPEADSGYRQELVSRLEAAVPAAQQDPEIVAPPRLRRVRQINSSWSVFEPDRGAPDIDPVQIARVLRAAGLTAQPNYVRFIDSLQAAPNYVAPNYVAPNYVAPNYVAPNYVAPNDVASGPGGAGACRCEPCPDAPHIERTVPMITARKAYGPLPGPAPTPLPNGFAAEIHVLDVRFQAQVVSTIDPEELKSELKEVRGRPDDVRALREEYEARITRSEGMPPTDRSIGLRPPLLRAANAAMRPAASDPVIEDEINAEIEAAIDAFVEEPTSAGLGANVNSDQFVDPATNHAEFIQGIIDRIVLARNGDSIVRHHAVAGTLGDVDDADLALAIDWVVENHTDPSKLQIMNLSLSGYTDDDLPDPVLVDSIEAAQAKKWLIVASAGNNGSCRLAYPAAVKGVVSVAAYGPCGPAFFSNHGPWVDACGPGVGVVSKFTKPSKDGLIVVDEPNVVTAKDEFAPDGHATWSGTSFSAPYVAAMLVVRAAREARKAGTTRTPEELREAAVAAIISDDDLIRFPGYGTIVSSEAVKVTTTREKNTP